MTGERNLEAEGDGYWSLPIQEKSSNSRGSFDVSIRVGDVMMGSDEIIFH